jgi:ATP citrate (pro-S)-lyase
LTNFLVEPFVPHPQETEYYININSVREGDNILFYHEGGVDVGDVDAKASRLLIGPSDTFPSFATIKKNLLSKVPEKSQDVLVDFITRLYSVYVDLQFTYLEINPLVVIPTTVPSPSKNLTTGLGRSTLPRFSCQTRSNRRFRSRL